MHRAAPLLLLCACLETHPAADAGSALPPDAGTATLAGSLSFPVTSATEVRAVDALGLTVGFGFVLADHGLTCAQLTALDGGPVPGAYQEVLGGVGCAEGCGPPGPGTYPIAAPTSPDARAAFLYLRLHPGDGGSVQSLQASSGSITLTTATPTELAGSFEAQVTDPASNQPTPLTGSFDVPFCP